MTQPPLRHLWVDLMPMLPGGANGGAKPFILQLLNALAQARPEVQISCSTGAAMVAPLHDALDQANLSLRPVRRWHRWRCRPTGAQLLFCPFGPPSLNGGGLPVVSTFYDLQVLAYPRFFSPAQRRQRLGHLRQLRHQARRIAAISEFSRQEGIRHGLDPERIRAIPIQMPTPAAEASGPLPGLSPPPDLELQPGRFFLYPANLWPHKNHELLFTAFAMACDQGLANDLVLVCTGDGQGRLDALRQLAQGLGLQGRLRLPGYVSASDLQALYTHSLAVVFPSLHEGFGMPVIEAMARGVPVCCSNGTALAEVAGEAALLVDPRHPQQIASALLRLAADPQLRQHLVEHGEHQAQRYLQPGRMAQAYWQLFEEAHRARPLP